MTSPIKAWLARLNELNVALLREPIPKSLEKRIKRVGLWRLYTPEQFFEYIKKAKEANDRAKETT